MALHDSTFLYLKVTAEQQKTMEYLRDAAKEYADCIEEAVPEGPDKTYLLRKLREVAMWCNIAITREPSGAPREVPQAAE
jgi:hypothetical protein